MESCAADKAFVHHLARHGSQLLNHLHDQWKDQKYCDLIISARGRPLPVHACVMSAFSPRIASLIAEKKSYIYNYSQLVTVKVRYSYSVMESIVSALYTGIFQPATNLLKAIGAASEFLQIKELTQVIMQYVNSKEQQIEPSACFTSTKTKEKEQTLICPSLLLNSECPELKSSLESSQHCGEKNRPEREFPICLGRDSTEKENICLKNLVIKITNLDLSALQHSIQTENTAHLDMSLKKREMSQPPDTKKETMENEVVEASEFQPIATTKKSLVHNELQINNTLDAKPVRKGKMSSFASKNNKRKSVALDVASESIVETASNRHSLELGVADYSSQTSETDSIDTHQAIPAEESQSLESTFIEEICPDDPVREELSQLLSNSKGIKCSKCFIKFTDLDYYQFHIQNHPTIDCDQCGQCFFNRFALAKHLRRVHLGLEYLVCRHCGLRTKSQVELRKHCTEVHNNNKPFACTYKDCKFTSKKHSALLYHVIIHNDTKEYMCDKCSMSFLRPLGLISHQRTCYQLQQFLCDLCGQSFNHSQSMRKHRQSMHFGAKPFKCLVCLNSFSDHRNLSRHMRIHNNSFPYACSICQQRFRHSNSLKAHINSKHQGIPNKNQLKLKKDTQKSPSVSNFKDFINQEENILKSKKKLKKKLAHSMKALKDTQENYLSS